MNCLVNQQYSDYVATSDEWKIHKPMPGVSTATLISLLLLHGKTLIFLFHAHKLVQARLDGYIVQMLALRNEKKSGLQKKKNFWL